ncbi:MAG: HAMP domain-containing histidine kinase [Alphaproteobacteria bacterium]|nr:HAMP domain-containing histidine kinase [Alphaproteobacteria bacterium]MBP9776912.1 HAMP domain-containing histidine kinase [Alphaproteobacteria bacterium]
MLYGGIAKDFRIILKPTLLWISTFVSFSLVLVATYVFIEHQRYLAAYQATQQLELKTLQQKTLLALENLKKLSQLTVTRIIDSHGDVKRIQNILSSVPRLNPNGTLPKIQKVFYNKLSPPQRVITLFGPSPLYSQSAPDVHTAEKETAITIDENVVVSKTTVFSERDTLGGVLEIQIDPMDFKVFLGNMETVTLNPPQLSKNEESNLLQKTPFAIYARPLNNFWSFVFVNQERYAFFYYFTVFGIILIVSCAYIINIRNKNTHKTKQEELEATLLKSTTEKNCLKEKLLACQQDHKSSQTSLESYINHLLGLNKRQNEQAAYIIKALSVVEQSFKNPMSSLSKKDQVELIESCLKVGESLSNNLVSKVKNVPIDLRALLEEVCALFAEKIYKLQVTINLFCSKDLNFQGDPLFTKFIVMNVIGKSIHSLSTNGKASIFVRKEASAFELEVQDNGYSHADTTEGLMERYPALFVKEDVFRFLCQNNGLKYETSRDENGLNVTKTVILSSLAETSSPNVIPLFPS